MNTQQLQCFVCVANTLNFTKAGEELFLSTPTVSHHIKSLEEELQVTLFTRTSKFVKLTQAGSIFYGDAKELLAKIDMSQKRVKKMDEKKLSILRIGCSSNAELASLQEIFADLHIHYPQVYPQIFVHDYFRLKSLFNEHQIDIILATKEMIKDIQNCTFKKIKEVSSFAIMTKDSPLALMKQQVCFNDLKDYSLITLHPRFIPFQYGNRLQEQLSIHAQAHFNLMCENDQAGILLASSGYGIAILPEFCIPSYLNDLSILPIEEETTIDYGIAYRKDVKETFIKFFIEEFKM